MNLVFSGIQKARHELWVDSFLNISKEDIAEIIAMNGSINVLDTQNRAEDPRSIDNAYAPSIDRQRICTIDR